jgi:hypothetical protein
LLLNIKIDFQMFFQVLWITKISPGHFYVSWFTKIAPQTFSYAVGCQILSPNIFLRFWSPKTTCRGFPFIVGH